MSVNKVKTNYCLEIKVTFTYICLMCQHIFSVPSMYSDWENVSGVSMTRFGSMLREQAFKKPLTDVIPPDSILAEAEVVHWLDLREVTVDDLKDIKIRHVAVANKPGKYQGKIKIEN